MILLTREKFSLLLEDLNTRSASTGVNRKSLYVAIADQVLSYATLHPSKLLDGSTADTHQQKLHAFFDSVSRELGLLAESQSSESDADDPAGRSHDLYKRMRRGISDWKFTIAVYYWFHRDEARAPFAAKIDRAVFGQPFHEEFNLSRDEYTPLVLDERDFAIGPIRFSTDENAATLHIKEEPLGSILDGGYPSPSRALSWQYGLTEMIGRDRQIEELKNWARSAPGEVCMRLLNGVGGSGKTRLASELAKELSKQKSKWNAGFLGNETDEVITIHTPAEGVLIVIDYPEERVAFVERLIDGLRDRSDAHVSVRILLLSRLDQSHWDHASIALEHRFTVQSTSAMEPLELTDAVSLVDDAYQQLATLTGTQPPRPEGAEAWLQSDRTHRLPLFAAAAALHAFLAPQNAFGLNGAEVVEALALIERDRVRAYSKAAGLSEYGLERLLSLATLSKIGLPLSIIERLSVDGLPIGQHGQSLTDALGKTPWWTAGVGIEGGLLQPLSPDRMAVAFLALTLLDSKLTNLPNWLSMVLPSAGPDAGTLLSRLLFDLSIHDRRYGEALEQLSLLMLDVSEATFKSFEEAAYREQTALSAPFAVKVIQKLLTQTKDQNDRATLLHNLSLNHERLGEIDSATLALEECVKIRRKLAFWPWSEREKRLALALSLSNYSNCLSKAGEIEQAAQASDEALRIRKQFAEQGESSRQREIAVSELNKANILIQSDQPDQALLLAESSISSLQKLERAEPGSVEAELARALHNKSVALTMLGRVQEALQVCDYAIEIRRRLSVNEPDKYTSDLGRILNNQSGSLLICHEFPKAYLVSKEALVLFQKLESARPGVFDEDIARSYYNMASSKMALEEFDEALSLISSSVEIYRSIRRKKPGVIDSKYAKALMVASRCHAETQVHQRAIDMAKKAVEVLEKMDKRPRDNELAEALHYLAAAFMTAGKFKEGEHVAAEIHRLNLAD